MKSLSVLFFISFLFVGGYSSASALSIVPISSSGGVVLSRVVGDRSGDVSSAYLLEINLASGASIRSSMTQTTSDNPRSPGFMLRPLVNGALTSAVSALSQCDPKDTRIGDSLRVASHLEVSSESHQVPFALFNGQFFGNYYSLQSGYTARLAFGVFTGGHAQSLGYGRLESYRKKILTISSTGASIKPYKLASAYAMKGYPDSLSVVGLHPFANKDSRSQSTLGRVYLGVGGDRINRQSSKIYALIATGLTEREAFALLKKAGARETLMMDGGGSTQLWAGGSSLISSSRPIPHAFAVYSK